MLEISIKWIHLHYVDLSSGAWQELDLLQGRRQEFGQQRPQAISSGVLLRRGALFGAVFPLIVLLVVMLFFVRLSWLKHRSQQLQPVAAEHAELMKRIQIAASALQTLESSNQTMAKAMADVRSSSALLVELQNLMPERLTLERLSSKGLTIDLAGLAAEPSGLTAVNALMLRMEQSSMVAPASVKLIRAERRMDDQAAELNFSLKAAFAADAAQETRERLLDLGAEGLSWRMQRLEQDGLLP
jgi:Tfp pilus assembly protein PilN